MDADDERVRTLITEVVRGSDIAEAPRAPNLRPGSSLSPRFEIEQRLGHGASGVVYRARDRQSGVALALKVLHLRDPDAIYWLKDEFRALADVVHPNINQLHELFHEADNWFFTMELVEGLPFCDALECREPRRPRRVDYPRLCLALGQLVDGVEAMHEAGKLHRDIKPSNVLVRPDGHVVILDFGLVQDLSILEGEESTTVLRDRVALICGTPEYMAPEQAAGLYATTASDWYAVGVMLYESLTGALPHRGDPIKIMVDKQLRDPPRPSSLQPGIPAELEALCLALLTRDPRSRPGPDEIRRGLGVRASARPAAWTSARVRSAPVLVGREPALDALRDAYAASSSSPVCVLVHGSSGIGKTALLRHFLDGLARESEVLVLSSRCFERESVPYKALDGLVDRFAAYLVGCHIPDLHEVLASDAAALLRVFPVLARCAPLRDRAQPEPRELDAQETRRRAFAAFRRLAGVVASRLRLVIFIDDLQWGDAESAQLLLELMGGAATPRILVLGSYRTEEARSSPLLSALLPALASGTSGGIFRELALHALEEAAAIGLAERMIGERTVRSRERARRIARESAGSPFFIEAFVQHHQASGWADTQPHVSLDQLVLERVSELPEPASLLLHVVVIAGQPLSQRIALQAAQLTGAGRALSLLRAGKLLRTRGQANEPALEPYHDRIREAVLGALPPERSVQLHAALADALEASGQAEPALLAWQHFGARRRERALPYALTAAAAACNALAFGHAAGLYALALECLPEQTPEALATRRAYADALANAGRAAEAAFQYERLATFAGAPSPEDLKACAAQHYLASGHVDQGLALLTPLMQAVGLQYPETSEQVVRILGESWQRIAARGMHVAPFSGGPLPAADLARIDLARLATDGLSHCDPIRAAAIMLQITELALELGEPGRAAWALSRYALLVSSGGDRATLATAEDWFSQAEELAAHSGDTLLLGSIHVNRSRLSLNAQRWQEGLVRAEHGASFAAEQCVGGWRLVGVANNAALYSLFALGRLRELGTRTFTQQQRAVELGDIYVHLTTFFYAAVLRLAADDPSAARAQLAAAGGLRKHAMFLFQDWLLLQGELLCDLYVREVERAWQRLEQRWIEVEQAHLLGLAVVREFAHRLSGNLAVSMALRARAQGSGDQAAYLERAEQRAAQLDASGGAFGRAAAHGLRAGIAWCEQRPADACRALETAQASYLEADMPLDAAAIAALAARVSDAPAAARREKYDALRSFGVSAPEYWVSLHVPWID